MLIAKNDSFLLNLKDVKTTDWFIDDNNVLRILIEIGEHIEICPHCASLTHRIIKIESKSVRDLNVFGRMCMLEFDHRHFECHSCFKTFMQPITFAFPYSYYTNRFENEVYRLCRGTSDKFD